jgi:DNA-binding transcriptional regulator YiaG
VTLGAWYGGSHVLWRHDSSAALARASAARSESDPAFAAARPVLSAAAAAAGLARAHAGRQVMALTDDIGRLAGILTRLMIQSGETQRLRIWCRLERSQIGKACGVTAETVQAWESGIAEPTPAQALAWLDCLSRGPRTVPMGIEGGTPVWAMNGHAEPVGAR